MIVENIRDYNLRMYIIIFMILRLVVIACIQARITDGKRQSSTIHILIIKIKLKG